MLDFFDFHYDFTVPQLLYEPHHKEHGHLGDNPDTHRWRAFWEDPITDGHACCITLRAVPVWKLTRFGAWIYPDGYGHWDGDQWVWELEHVSRDHCRLVMNFSGQSWAKMSQAEALKSLAVRLERHSLRLRHEVQNARIRAKALRQLQPGLEGLANTALSYVREIPEPKLYL